MDENKKFSFFSFGKEDMWIKVIFYIVVLAVLSGAMMVVCSCGTVNKFFGLKSDNAIEEISEQVVEQNTGMDLDFTPETPEK